MRRTALHSSRVVLILITFGLTAFGVLRLAQTLETRKERAVLVIVFIVAVVWLVLKLVDLGVLGRMSSPPA